MLLMDLIHYVLRFKLYVIYCGRLFELRDMSAGDESEGFSGMFPET